MRLVLPVPFGEIRIQVRRTRQPRAIVWYTLLSALLHVLFVSLIAGSILHAFVSVKQPQRQPVMVSISSALRIEPHTHPLRANHPIERPKPQPRRASVPRASMPQRDTTRAIARAELSKPSRVAYAQPRTLTTEQIEAQTRAFERTIAQARAASDPVAGAAQTRVVAAASRRSMLNLQGNFGPPQPEGILYPLKRWVDGAYVYYYVRYDAEYADGSTESGIVPWPIRFPVNADPFERGIHRMPLPGPLPDYVLPHDVAMHPLVKNCYDHHYEYCPIAHE